VLATQVIRSKKKLMRRECLVSLTALYAVNRKREEEAVRPTRGANGAPEPTCEVVLCVEEGRMATPFSHIYNNTELMNYWILKDTIRDRQSSWATSLFWEKDAPSWKGHTE